MIIDVSEWQTYTIADYEAIKAAGVRAVIARATVGQDYADKRVLRHVERSRRAGLLPCELYHYAYPESDRDAGSEAQNFADAINLIARSAVVSRVWLDLEEETAMKRLGPDRVLAWADAFLQALEGLIPASITIGLYSFPAYLQRLPMTTAKTRDWSTVPLWLAQWGTRGTQEPTKILPWDAWRNPKGPVLWQYTNKGTVGPHTGDVSIEPYEEML